MSPQLGHLSLELGFALCLYLRIMTFSDRLSLMECVGLGKNVHDIISTYQCPSKSRCKGTFFLFFFLMWAFHSPFQAVVVGQKAGMSSFQWGLGERRGVSVFRAFFSGWKLLPILHRQCNLGTTDMPLTFPAV